MKKRNGGLISQLKPHCPVCDSIETGFKYRIERHAFDVWQCNNCYSEFQYPLPPSANSYYDEGYYTGAAAFSYQDERKKEYYHNFVHRARLKSIQKFCRIANGNAAKFLDVGCAFGAFVRAAAHHGEAFGLDVSAYAVKEGNKIRSEVNPPAQLFQGDLAHLPRSAHARKIFAPASFTAITLVEVAEHLQSPRTAFMAAYKLLQPGGVLVIQTANFEGWQAVKGGADYHYYLPGHLVYYTASGLKRLLSDIGFREFKEFFPVDFSLWTKWRKAWGDVHRARDLTRLWKMSFYHLKSKFKWRVRPLTSSYVLYARK